MPNRDIPDYRVEAIDGDERETRGQVIRANDLLTVERRNRVLTLRRQGFTYEAIAETLREGKDDREPIRLTASGAAGIVREYVAELSRADADSAETLRVIDNERLERMFRRLELQAASGDPKTQRAAVLAQLKVLDRHARLNGLDAPTKLDLSGKIDHAMIADPAQVKAIDESFARRHGSKPIALPAGHAREK